MRHSFFLPLLALLFLSTSAISAQTANEIQRPMKKNFIKIDPTQIPDNIISMIGNDWMLITAGSITDGFNTMTASWGNMGYLWEAPVATVYVRPQRHTFGFIENSDHYTLCFFDDQYKDILSYCGSHSGKDGDKIAATGLIPIPTHLGNVFFEQARLVIECEKVYSDDLRKDRFLKPGIPEKTYPKNDYHRFYIGKIVNVWIQEAEAEAL